MVPLATQIISADIHHQPCDLATIPERIIPYFGVKEAVFPFNMFPEVDPILGPEMRSTGEVMGIANTFGEAFFKAQEAAKNSLPLEGTVLISVKQRDKEEIIPIAKKFHELGFKILATDRTNKALEAANIPSDRINKLREGSPHIVDAIGQHKIDIIINSTDDGKSVHEGSYISKAAIKYTVSYITTLAAARAAVKGIEAQAKKSSPMQSLQTYHNQLK
jgi:carbamoyl-phosphate synthase large subunit